MLTRATESRRRAAAARRAPAKNHAISAARTTPMPETSATRSRRSDMRLLLGARLAANWIAARSAPARRAAGAHRPSACATSRHPPPPSRTRCRSAAGSPGRDVALLRDHAAALEHAHERSALREQVLVGLPLGRAAPKPRGRNATRPMAAAPNTSPAGPLARRSRSRSRLDRSRLANDATSAPRRDQDERDRRRGGGGHAQANARVAAHCSGRSTKPTPRTVWIMRGSPSASSLRRR